MATAAVAGYGGSITGVSGEVLNWSCDVTVEALDATSMASGGWREFISGLKGATGSAEFQGATAPSTGAVETLTLNSGTNTISGAAIVTRVATNVPVDGKVTWNIDFSYTGIVTLG